MKSNLIKYIKTFFYLIVFTSLNVASAGSFDDFFKAVKIDDSRGVQQLLARGFDVNTINPDGDTGLVIAVREESLKVAQLLINAPRADLNALNAKGESALMLACLKGQSVLAEAMIKKGADVNKTGWTPLHYAASGGQPALIRLLIENHAYIDAESPNGSTPLMMASMYGTTEAVELLLDEGADTLLKNQQGLTATQFAQRADRENIVQIIKKASAASRPAGQW